MSYRIEKIPHMRLAISDDVLDTIGFTEYWDSNGDSGDRRLVIGDSVFEIIECGIIDDDMYGYGSGGKYATTRWYYKSAELFFLHDMYKCIEADFPAEFLSAFEEICRKKKMGPYLDSYFETLKD
jgi:hypothetical protein